MIAPSDGFSPALHKAVEVGSIAGVLAHLRRGGDVNQHDQDGLTPLHRAMCVGHGEVVTCLVFRGANVEAVDCSRHSPLHWASEASLGPAGFLATVARADPTVLDKNGDSPIAVARTRSMLSWLSEERRAKAGALCEFLTLVARNRPKLDDLGRGRSFSSLPPDASRTMFSPSGEEASFFMRLHLLRQLDKVSADWVCLISVLHRAFVGNLQPPPPPALHSPGSGDTRRRMAYLADSPPAAAPRGLKPPSRPPPPSLEQRAGDLARVLRRRQLGRFRLGKVSSEVVMPHARDVIRFL